MNTKRILAMLLALTMILALGAGCSSGQESASTPESSGGPASANEGTDAGSDGDKPVYAFISKTLADPIFVIMFDGFSEYCDSVGVEAIYRGTDIPTPEKEIEVINQMVAQNVDAICVIAADFDALQPSLEKAMERGIAVVTFDSAANPASRQVHVEQASIDELGRAMMDSALKMAEGSGEIGILSAQPQSQLHNDWIDAMMREVEDNPDAYADITILPVAYGDDLPDKSTSEAQAMLQNYPDLKVIVSPTTVGSLAAAKVIQDQGSSCKVTGVALPSEIYPYIENDIVPEIYLWDPIDQGYLTAATAHAIVQGQITGAVGEGFSAGRLGDFAVEDYFDGGTQVLLGDPLKFDISNIKEYKDQF